MLSDMWMVRLPPERQTWRALMMTLVGAACAGGGDGGGAGPSCIVSSITVTPAATSLAVGQSTALTAAIAGTCPNTPSLAWSVSDSARLTLVGTGLQVTVTAVSISAIPVTVRVVAGGVAGTAAVTVIPPILIQVSSDSLNFTAANAGLPTPAQTVSIGGGVTDLSLGTVSYGPGASGWLMPPQLSGPATPATLVVQPMSGLAPGSYRATIPVLSGSAQNSPRLVSVHYSVGCLSVAPAPITLGTPVNGSLAGGDCSVAGGFFIDRYRLVIAAATDVQIDLSSGSFNPTLELRDSTAASVIASDDNSGPGTDAHLVRNLAAGSYVVQVTNVVSGATGAYQLRAGAPSPLIELSATSASFLTGVGALGRARTVNITNAGPGTLTGLAVGSIAYGPGATGWLQTGLSSTTASPSSVLTLQPSAAGLAVGTYTATVPVTSTAASNSPRNLAVTMVVYVPGPYDGDWSGSNSPYGESVDFTVRRDSIVSFSMNLGTQVGAPACFLRYDFAPNHLLTGTGFSIGAPAGSSVTGTVTGTFSSPTTASGGFGTITFNNYFCPPNLLVSGPIAGGSWSATRQ